MIFGVLAVVTTIFLVGLIFAPIGLILGIVALVKANRKPHQYGGKGFAIAGVATSGLVTLFLPIVLAIAIPNLFAARRAANEGSALQTMRTLADAETSYRKNSKGTCADLKTLIGSNLVEGKIEKEEKNGYRFNIINYPLGGCEITATPLSTSDGDRSFYFSTDDSLIRAAKKNGRTADKNDRLLSDEMASPSESSKPSGSGMVFEGVALSDLKTLQGAQTTYISTTGMGKCCADFQTLVSLGLIKPDLADGEDAGYRFQFSKLTTANGEYFEITATPISTSSGARSFFMSPRDGLRGAAKNGLAADKTDPPVE
jgi:type II secretory pathway pseudopilin PulG